MAFQDSVSRLYLRPLSGIEATPIAGTEGGTNPFFSPDGEWIAFFGGGLLRRVRLPGGAPQTISEAPSYTLISAIGSAGDWSPDGMIFASLGTFSPIYRVAASGGVPEPVTTLSSAKEDAGHTCPELLPQGKAVLFTSYTGTLATFDDAQIEVQLLSSGERRTLISGGACARYLPTGHLLYVRAGELFAVPFDAADLSIEGPAISVAKGVVTWNHAVHFAVSDSGTLAYVPGYTHRIDRSLLLAERNGSARPLLQRQAFADATFSPDTERIAIRLAAANDDLWMYEMKRQGLTRLTVEPGDQQSPVWTPDGQRVAYGSAAADQRGVFWKPAEGGDSELLVATQSIVYPGGWSPDAQVLAYTEMHRSNRGDIVLLPLKERKPRPFVQSEFHEWGPRFSPDGRWVSYTSDESGSSEVYLKASNGSGSGRQVSIRGGSAAVWARNTWDLFFRNGARIMVTPIDRVTGMPGTARALFDAPDLVEDLDYSPRFDVTPDGQRFVLITKNQTPPVTEIRVAVNWHEELKRLVPTK